MKTEAIETWRTEVKDLYAKHGIGAKFVRAYCKANGWRYNAQGAPAQWYEWWPAIAEALA